jgi:hypothetical protein
MIEMETKISVYKVDGEETSEPRELDIKACKKFLAVEYSHYGQAEAAATINLIEAFEERTKELEASERKLKCDLRLQDAMIEVLAGVQANLERLLEERGFFGQAKTEKQIFTDAKSTALRRLEVSDD